MNFSRLQLSGGRKRTIVCSPESSATIRIIHTANPANDLHLTVTRNGSKVDTLPKTLSSFLKSGINYAKTNDLKSYTRAVRRAEPLNRDRSYTQHFIFTKLRTFFMSIGFAERTSNNPFKLFQGYRVRIWDTLLPIQGRYTKLYHTNLSRHPGLPSNRIFSCIQCQIGCPRQDLLKMTKENVMEGAIGISNENEGGTASLRSITA